MNDVPIAETAGPPARLTRVVRVMLRLSVAVAVVSMLLTSLALAHGARVEPGFNLSILVRAVVLLGEVLVFVATAVPFLMWVHRAHRTAAHQGARDLSFTPGWAVGWFFVPVFMFWKPYQAMKELWCASKNPGAWRTEKVSPLVVNWWTLWLIAWFVDQVSFRLQLRAGDEYATQIDVLNLISGAVDVGLCVVAARMVGSIYRMQAERGGRHPACQ